tara:strand:+ start:3587 stop:3826 length:240 start_codon:yes stop_codon:yes gene_type:complete
MLDIEKLKHLIREEIAKDRAREEKIAPELESLYTENEACEFLKISRPTMLKLRKGGKVNYFTTGNGIRYKKSDLLNIAK